MLTLVTHKIERGSISAYRVVRDGQAEHTHEWEVVLMGTTVDVKLDTDPVHNLMTLIRDVLRI